MDLDNNNIASIPKSIKSSGALIRLLLSNNSITQLPIELFNINIETLYLWKPIKHDSRRNWKGDNSWIYRFNTTNITTIPDRISNLEKLDIDVRNNVIIPLPQGLEALNKLENFYLHGNPVCSNGWIDNSASEKMKDLIYRNKAAGCTVQCSIYCQNILKRR